MSPPATCYIFLVPFFLVSQPVPVASNKMLGDLGRWFHRTSRDHLAVLACTVLEFITFPYIKSNSIHSVFSRLIIVILHFNLRVPCVCFFSFSVCLVSLHPTVLDWHLRRRWGYCSLVHRYSNAYGIFFNRHWLGRVFYCSICFRLDRQWIPIRVHRKAFCSRCRHRRLVKVHVLSDLNLF